IVNGDSVGEKLKESGMDGDILVWREVYTAGPVYRDMADADSRKERASFMELALGVPGKEYIAICEAQESALQAAGAHEEILLWFEHDLFDQTMLSRLLYSLSYCDLGETKINLLNIDSFPGMPNFRGLGELSAEQLRALEGSKRRLSLEELKVGREIWRRYASPDLSDHIPLAQRDWPKLPFMRQAMQAHLSRLPSSSTGLGIIEQTTLEAVAGGIQGPIELFEHVGSRLHLLGMGDLEYWHRLKLMIESPFPLLRMAGDTDFPDFRQPSPGFRSSDFALTELGRQALAGQSLGTGIHPSDIWLGGFRLCGGTQWRWDRSRGEAVLL
ncbi:MAG: sigma-70 family polymerase sigma factor, partial [Paenibacillus sp.]|nr:sigma-70 family polymerase sigma factor [Paenibacillus sp.]